MPIESAQYINTLQPDWPQGVDPESDGDDHIRMVKQVLQNTFPALDSPVNGTPTQINDLTSHIGYVAGDGTAGNAERIEIHNGDWTSTMLAAAAMGSKDQLNGNTALLVNWEVIKQMIYPVGAVLMNSGNNPADYLGFGDWVALTGWITGVGTVTDSQGAQLAIPSGAYQGYLRVHNETIVSAQIELSMDAVDNHQHYMDRYPLMEDGKNAEGSGGYSAPASYTNQLTDPAGAHTPSGRVTIGTGDSVSGEFQVPPSTGVYVWQRVS